MTDAYRTLINRFLLKILGFEREYIDYYLPDRPEKNIMNPLEFKRTTLN
ncbi:MAG: hypothetical protein ACLQG5_06205 [Methanobacterium sp.]